MEAAEIDKRGMKEAAEESEVKSAVAKTTAKAANSVSSDGVFSATIASSNAASAFARAHTSTSSVVGVARRSGYTLIIIIL